ncbi:MAG: hypothetical protein EBR79_04505 [Proteobacteria bacterium]|nr:hypothetical protein [Pseudomonadota bacterium]
MAAAPQGAKLRNGIRAFEWMQEQAQAQGVRLIVMFIPSIDLVVGKSLQERGLPVAPMLAQSPKGEVAQRELFMEMFRRSGIEYVDALPAMVAAYDAALAQNRQIYPPGDQHPLEEGYAAYARSLTDYLQQHPQPEGSH